MSKLPKFELGNVVYFLYESGRQFVIVRREYRPHSGNWHYLLRGGKWRIEDDLSHSRMKGANDVQRTV